MAERFTETEEALCNQLVAEGFLPAEVLGFCKDPFSYGSKWMAAVYFLRIIGGQTVAYGSCFSDAHELAGGKKALDDFTGCRTADA